MTNRKNKVQHKNRISRIRPRAAAAGMALVAVLAPGVVATSSAQAPTETVLYTFTGGTDGAWPLAGLVRDQAGNLYGTTDNGGALSCGEGIPLGCGVVFKVNPAGQETVLHAFNGGTDGATPGLGSGLFRDAAGTWDLAGNFYGVTYAGGPSGYGTVFKVDWAGKETVLYAFTGGTDGGSPNGYLIRDAKGNLYGTAQFGGDLSQYGGAGAGVVFKLDATGKETVLRHTAVEDRIFETRNCCSNRSEARQAARLDASPAGDRVNEPAVTARAAEIVPLPHRSPLRAFEIV